MTLGVHPPAPGSHTCPVRECRVSVSRGLLMCGPHWALVPRDIQVTVYVTWRTWRSGKTEAIHAYMDARTAAITAVETTLGLRRDPA